MKNILLKILCVIVVVTFSLTAFADTYRCTASQLNIRNSADKSGKIIGHIAQNETVSVISVEGNWGTLLVNEDTGYVCMDYLENAQKDNYCENDENEPWTDKQKTIFWICFAFAIAIYVFAIVKVRQGELVVIRGWLDLGLLAFPWISLFLTLIGAHEFLGIYLFVALWIAAGVCFIASLVLSVVANWGNLFYVIFSLIMKLVVIPIIGFGLFYVIGKLSDEKGLTLRSLKVFLIVGLLVGGLMSFDE